MKAFIANNFIFYNERKRNVMELNEDSLQQARFVKITWRVQKNHQNSQSITLTAESDQPEMWSTQNMPCAQRNAIGTMGQAAESAGWLAHCSI